MIDPCPAIRSTRSGRCRRQSSNTHLDGSLRPDTFLELWNGLPEKNRTGGCVATLADSGW